MRSKLLCLLLLVAIASAGCSALGVKVSLDVPAFGSLKWASEGYAPVVEVHTNAWPNK